MKDITDVVTPKPTRIVSRFQNNNPEYSIYDDELFKVLVRCLPQYHRLADEIDKYKWALFTAQMSDNYSDTIEETKAAKERISEVLKKEFNITISPWEVPE